MMELKRNVATSCALIDRRSRGGWDRRKPPRIIDSEHVVPDIAGVR